MVMMARKGARMDDVKPKEREDIVVFGILPPRFVQHTRLLRHTLSLSLAFACFCQANRSKSVPPSHCLRAAAARVCGVAKQPK